MSLASGGVVGNRAKVDTKVGGIEHRKEIERDGEGREGKKEGRIRGKKEDRKKSPDRAPLLSPLLCRVSARACGKPPPNAIAWCVTSPTRPLDTSPLKGQKLLQRST